MSKLQSEPKSIKGVLLVESSHDNKISFCHELKGDLSVDKKNLHELNGSIVDYIDPMLPVADEYWRHSWD